MNKYESTWPGSWPVTGIHSLLVESGLEGSIGVMTQTGEGGKGSHKAPKL